MKRYDLLNNYGDDVIDIIIDNDLNDVIKYSDHQDTIEEKDREIRELKKENLGWYDSVQIYKAEILQQQIKINKLKKQNKELLKQLIRMDCFDRCFTKEDAEYLIKKIEEK